MRGTPTAGVLLHWVIISRRWEQNHKHKRERPIKTDSPRKKLLRLSGWTVKFQDPIPQNTQNSLIQFYQTSSSTRSNYLYVYSHHITAFGPFVNIFHVKMMV